MLPRNEVPRSKLGGYQGQEERSKLRGIYPERLKNRSVKESWNCIATVDNDRKEHRAKKEESL